jgi:hypothetical protein
LPAYLLRQSSSHSSDEELLLFMAYNKPSPWLLSLSFALFNISQSYDLKRMTNNGLLF